MRRLIRRFLGGKEPGCYVTDRTSRHFAESNDLGPIANFSEIVEEMEDAGVDKKFFLMSFASFQMELGASDAEVSKHLQKLGVRKTVADEVALRVRRCGFISGEEDCPEWPEG